ncbi:MAG: hypothetical protein H8D55_01255 [Deltaproteobacteria bacterium]|nr:hypothetical protein [Deltaproteobacteria bacterium]
MKISGAGKGESRSRYLTGRLCIAVALSLIMILPATAATRGDGGILQQEIKEREDLISVKLIGVTEYEVTEMFNDLLVSAPGVVEARRYRFRLNPQRPASCIVEWQVKIGDTDAFQLESSLFRMLRDAASHGTEDETIVFTFDPTAEDLATFNDIRPWRASSSEIQFVSGRPWRPAPFAEGRPYEGGRSWRTWPDAGFE